MFDLASAIAPLCVPYTVTRRTKAAPVQGKYVAGATATVTVQGMAQSLSGQKAERVPEGIDPDASLAFWSLSAIYATSDTYEPDVVTHQGKPYEVKLVKPYDEHGGFWQAIMERKDT